MMTEDEIREAEHEYLASHLCRVCWALVVEHIHISVDEALICEEDHDFKCEKHE